MKQTMYLVVWQAIRLKESEWSKMYERLVPIKCSFNEKTRQYAGRGKVMGRIAGQMISVMFTLLKSDQETLSKTPSGTKLPDPVLYDPAQSIGNTERGNTGLLHGKNPASGSQDAVFSTHSTSRLLAREQRGAADLPSYFPPLRELLSLYV